MFKDGKGFMICSYSLISFLHYLHKPTLNGVLCHKNSNPCGRPEGDGFGIRRGRCCRCCALRCKGEMRIGATETKRREAFMGNWKYRNTTKVMILFHLSVSMNQGIFFGEMEWKWCVFAADDLLFSYCWRCYLCFKITQGTTPLLPDASVPLGSSCNSVGITAGKSSCSVVLRISFGKQGYQVSLLVAKSWSDFMPIFSRCFNSKRINMESKLQTCRLQLIPRIRLPKTAKGNVQWQWNGVTTNRPQGRYEDSSSGSASLEVLVASPAYAHSYRYVTRKAAPFTLATSEVCVGHHGHLTIQKLVETWT